MPVPPPEDGRPTLIAVIDEDGREVMEDAQIVATPGTSELPTLFWFRYGEDPAEA